MSTEEYQKRKEYHKIYAKAYRENHKKELHDYKKAYNDSHKEQNRDYGKAYHESHLEQERAYVSRHYKENKEKQNLRSKLFARKQSAKWKKELMKHYGNKCACCGEIDPMFLAVDHIDNNGAQHRKEIGGVRIYKWLIENNFPPGFQILCHNCNLAKEFYGECPHETARKMQVDYAI